MTISVTVPVCERVISFPCRLNLQSTKPFVVVRGPNGSGKTTLLKAILGLRPTNGKASIVYSNGGVMTTLDPTGDRSCVRYLPQNPDEGLFTRLSVADNIAVLKQLLRIRDASFAQVYERIHASLQIAAADLSVGQKKLFLMESIVASLEGVPEEGGVRVVVVLLDEPLAGLDPMVRSEVGCRLVAAGARYGASGRVFFVIVDHAEVREVGGAPATELDLRPGVKFTYACAESVELV